MLLDSLAIYCAFHRQTLAGHVMSDATTSDYLVISRGRWDPDATPQDIQGAIDRFYVWLDDMVAQGRMRAGQRLAREGKVVSNLAITDGPFSEGKEVIGGYWFIVARSLEEAARLAAQNPCLAYGLSYEIRPTESIRASAFSVTNETPLDPA
jgi:hypothetical protein